MDVKMRIQTCRLIEQMNKRTDYSRQLGLENHSLFCIKKENNINNNIKEDLKNG